MNKDGHGPQQGEVPGLLKSRINGAKIALFVVMQTTAVHRCREAHEQRHRENNSQDPRA